MDERKRRRMVGGAILIVVGLFGLLGDRLEDVGPGLVLGSIGAAFLVAYLGTRKYGFLVPAGVLLGMSAGQFLEVARPDLGRSVLLGMGAGFFLIWLLHLAYQKENVWWPVFPGTVLVLLGLPLARETVEMLFGNWPILVIVVGALLLAAAFFGRDGARRGARPQQRSEAPETPGPPPVP